MFNQSYWLPEWCALRRVSKSQFYKWPPEKRPRIHYNGRRPLISPAADAEWLAAREAEAAANPVTTWARGLQDGDDAADVA